MNAGAAFGKSKLLTPEMFGRFLQWLSPEHEKAALRYLELRSKLVRSFDRRGCAHAEELADRTLDRVAVIVWSEPDRYTNPMALCFGVSRKVWLEYLREATLVPLEPENIPAPEREDSAELERVAACLDQCMDGLPEDKRGLMFDYHRFRGRQKIEFRRHLAMKHGGIEHLRVITCRIRTRLSHCIDRCISSGNDSMK